MAIFRSRGGSSLTLRLPMTMSPAVCFSSPAIMRKSVVLPHPLGPRRTRNSPSRTARSTPSTAVWSPHSLRSAFVSTMAMERFLQQLALLPLRPDGLGLVLGLLERVLGLGVAGRHLGEHGVEGPARVQLVDG